MLPTLFITLLLLPLAVSLSPASAPVSGANDEDNLVPDMWPAPNYSQLTPSPIPSTYSSPAASPSPSAAKASSPAPAPSESSNEKSVDEEEELVESAEESSSEESNNMSGGQKAGVALGVLAGAGLVGLAVFVYRKRQENMRRARYGYVARQMV